MSSREQYFWLVDPQQAEREAFEEWAKLEYKLVHHKSVADAYEDELADAAWNGYQKGLSDSLPAQNQEPVAYAAQGDLERFGREASGAQLWSLPLSKVPADGYVGLYTRCAPDSYGPATDQMRTYAAAFALQCAPSPWVSIEERLPLERERSYVVVTIAVKKYNAKSNYPGLGIRAVNQDWVVRRWPENFTHWCELPPAPAKEGAQTKD